MEPDMLEIRSRKLGGVLRILGLALVILGVVYTAVLLSFSGGDAFEQMADDLMMDPGPMITAAGTMIVAVIVSGIVSATRFSRGWLVLFATAPFLTTMTLLMGVGSMPLIRNIFLVLMGTALVSWTAAVIHYFYDLYR